MRHQHRRSACNGGPAVASRQPDYQRARDLPKVVPLFEHELETPTLERHLRLLGLIRRALRTERNRGLAGEWSYDLARHAAMLRVYRAERAAYLDRLRRARHARHPSQYAGHGRGQC